MESLGYILSNKFIILAVDTNFIVTTGNVTIKTNNTKKVYKLNDHLFITVIGQFHKITDIYNFVLKLYELKKNKSFDELVEDFESTFSCISNKDLAEFKALSDLIPSFTDANDVIDTAAFLEYLNSNPDLKTVAKELFEIQTSGLKNPATIHVFGFENYPFKIRMKKYILIGDRFKGVEISQISRDNIYMCFSSSTKTSKEIENLEKKLLNDIQPLIIEGWENSAEMTKNLVNAAKQKLEDGLKIICPFDKTPNIVFYELSANTNYIFNEPPIDLKSMSFNRPKE